ncbi:MAG: hypothetical protein KAW67_01355 [Candidatus Eisenbacteria sp.]|nr:hypothetical protein [Candidatus Eisenbacteria bacterium]
MRLVLASALVLLLGLTPVWAAGPLNLSAPHTEPMDGINTFPPVESYVTEVAHSTPVGGTGTDSDLWGESSAFHYFVDTEPYVDVPLEGGSCMDVRRFWLAWDDVSFFVGVQGPNELWENGDLFIAIDTDNLTGPGITLAGPWAKAVDFCEWDPEFFIAVEAPVSTGGFAALLDDSGGVVKQFVDGVDAANSPTWVSCDDGGMYYEFAITFQDIGITPTPLGTQVNFAILTTYEDDGFDAYDTGPGSGQVVVWEEIGDYPYDADHCDGDVDCVSGVEDICGAAESDDDLGAGVATAGRYPGSDNTTFDVDTIQEYYGITDFAAGFASPVTEGSWGTVKARFGQ